MKGKNIETACFYLKKKTMIEKSPGPFRRMVVTGVLGFKISSHANMFVKKKYGEIIQKVTLESFVHIIWDTSLTPAAVEKIKV